VVVYCVQRVAYLGRIDNPTQTAVVVSFHNFPSNSYKRDPIEKKTIASNTRVFVVSDFNHTTVPYLYFDCIRLAYICTIK